MNQSEKFQKLMDYYKACFEMVDCFHYNSNVTRAVYEHRLSSINGRTITITHKGIADNRQKKSFSKNGLVIGFIGNETPYKGLPLLLKAIDGLNIDIMIWGGRKKDSGRVHYRGRYSSSQLAQVYEEMDLLVVPSIWKETFSLITLESLSYGVPVLVSDNVGAQNIVFKYDDSFVYHSVEELREKLESFVWDKTPLERFNRSILDNPWNYDIQDHVQDIVDNIYK